MTEMTVAKRQPVRTALVYDFDGTLAPGNIQEHKLLPEYLGITPADFWKEVKATREVEDADMILTYMRLLLEKAAAKGLPLTKEILESNAKQIPLFEGVRDWFRRINRHAADIDLALEHYVISSGNQEMIEATAIASFFEHTFGCRYAYDATTGRATWPALTINYTTKTQYLFRINKGVLNAWNDEDVNRWVPMDERPIPFQRMIYFGDGDTDIPSMKMVRSQGGHSIAVFDPNKWRDGKMQRKVFNLIAEDRADFVVPADYLVGSQLDITVKGVLGRIARDSREIPRGFPHLMRRRPCRLSVSHASNGVPPGRVRVHRVATRQRRRAGPESPVARVSTTVDRCRPQSP